MLPMQSVMIVWKKNRKVMWCLIHLHMVLRSKECTGSRKVMRREILTREIHLMIQVFNDFCFYIYLTSCAGATKLCCVTHCDSRYSIEHGRFYKQSTCHLFRVVLDLD